MKIFFTASQRGKKKFLPYYEKIAEAIKQARYTLLDDDLLTQKTDDFYSKFEGNDHRAFVEFYEREIENIKSADINVFDTSFGSLSIGFIIEKSLEFNKPTIVLYYKENTPFFLSGIQDEKVIMASYDDKNIVQVVQKSLENASELRDKRFNFFISPELLNYLETSSKKVGVTKSLFIRNLILEHRRKNSVRK